MKTTLLLATLSFLSTAFAYEAQIKKGDFSPTLEAMLKKASAETRVEFDPESFALIEERELATSNFKFYVQTSEFIPVEATAVRIWTDKATNKIILGEMHLSEEQKKNEPKLRLKYRRAKFSQGALKSKQLDSAVRAMALAEVQKHDTDKQVRGIKSRDLWSNGDLVRKVEVKGRRGTHFITVSLFQNKVIEANYLEFPQAEAYTTLKANVFPMYEEVEETHEMLPHEVRELKYISTQIADGGENPLDQMSQFEYKEDKYNPLLAETEVGAQYGIWSEHSIRRQVESIVSTFPMKENSLSTGLLLQGKYATVQIHPDAQKAFPGINFKLRQSTNHKLDFVQIDGVWHGQARAGFYGQPINSESDLLSRIPFRSADHDATKYINSGVDEAQVYYAVTALMEDLTGMGFNDPELSSKPFHAFLFDPDIGMRDNAYYTDNTINFTTYNPEITNLARDNPTIWHELGHAVMERLMGSFLVFGDTKAGYGGLSEGMADFVAKIVVEKQTDGQDFPGKFDFRIMNNTGFYLTNEFHDEGEAYGGAMNDMLAEVIARDGKPGLAAFTELTIETMRLTRNHPSLTARGWFEHMVYADELGSDVRAPGLYADIINQALAKRNFAFDASFKAADMKVTSILGELTNVSPASRERPLTPCPASGVVSYDLKVKLSAGDADFIKFPATVKVEYKKGALQGAIKWDGEAQNPQVYTINSAADVLTVPLRASMTCDTVNQPDGSCKDYAYLQVFNNGADKKPVAKKRFYLKLNPNCAAAK